MQNPHGNCHQLFRSRSVIASHSCLGRHVFSLPVAICGPAARKLIDEGKLLEAPQTHRMRMSNLSKSKTSPQSCSQDSQFDSSRQESTSLVRTRGSTVLKSFFLNSYQLCTCLLHKVHPLRFQLDLYQINNERFASHSESTYLRAGEAKHLERS